jgi:hypothetical protein
MRRRRAAAALVAAACLLAPQADAASNFLRPMPRDAVGPICGDAAIVGMPVPRIEGEGGCGVRRPVEVRSVAGVALTPPPTITCETARALATWVSDSARPGIARLRERLVGLDVAAAYVCRNVNRARTGKLSEHAYGRAIDISGFRLADGRTLTVTEGWEDGTAGPALRRIHAGGCGPFGTTLGPGSDGFHETHFHYDIDRHGGRPYCR